MYFVLLVQDNNVQSASSEGKGLNDEPENIQRGEDILIMKEEIKDEISIKAEIYNAMTYMLECLLDKEERKCKTCKCVDSCTLLTEAVFICRSKKIKKPGDCH